ncbi:Pfs, NACHT and Ankyrin domain protein [Metarhizium guizhouense ARSEF 977]|uniref:Pfs, NACHT and Ankyrin domain protein n=1 Tax=Metarhizium guizhouense (strain ARSEF 977) TaxID=1276136 RepID=A0A0B4GK24_METGA|nr:Pfs, NACHT and Ankyrin domain protein [Metarhizium guizhouense ARSEF 977]
MSEQATAEERSHDLEGSLLQDAQPPSSAPTGPLDYVSSVLRQISRQEPRDRDFAVHILTWLMFAKRDLRPAQLEQAYAIQQTGDASNRDFNRPGEDIVSVCKGLVKLRPGVKSKWLVEFVRRPNLDQLLQYGLVDRKPHLTIIRTCLTCLQSDEFAESESSPETMERLRQDESLLMYYAATRWMDHLPDMDAKSGELAEGEELITQFLLRGKGTTGWFQFLERISGENVLVLHVAAMIGQVPVMKNLLETGKHKVNATTSHGRTALHLAAKHKRASVVRMLLETSAQLDIQDARGNTALHYGAISSPSYTPESHLETVLELLRGTETGVGGVDIRSKCTAIRSRSNKTPWDYALEAARMFKGPWPVESDKYRLARAKMEAQYEIAKLVTFWPWDKSVKSIKEEGDYLPPLRQVMALDSSAAVKARLVDALSQRGRTVDRRPTVEVKDLSETTPIFYAIASNKAALVDMLLEENEKDTKLLTDAYERQLCFMAWILLQTGADENHRRKDKPSALHCAILFRSKSLVSLLLAYGAYLEIRYDNKTPLDLAIELGETDIVRQLLVNDGFAIRRVTTNMMFTALPLAILEGRKEMIHMLSGLQLTPIDAFREHAKVTLAALARAFRETVRSKDLHGSTVLHLALSSRARSSCYEMLLSMLLYGADVDAEDEKGRTPLMLAKELGLDAEMTLLEMHSSKSDMEHQPISFNGYQPISFNRYQPISFNRYQPISFNRHQPISFNRYRPISFNRYQPTSFNRHQPISFNRYRPISFNRDQGISVNRYQPTSFNRYQPISFNRDQGISVNRYQGIGVNRYQTIGVNGTDSFRRLF